ncbi:heavy metal-associated isoprenylated plant protein 30-like isoform X1 [Coffea arabica]|uniref:Heavy metal-associated isoprenylated plant protein 30-like isoform X1 n=1 Tax=Coffea arabica TaxID=13443 RepID=A0A6P6TQJ1_COFAR|nr:heavy metal-associated isoprenylated plant protein 30-like isoform X1 [Coffea arabica]XP_027080257.1 heavy metal-associated isoprenylated plant protein 30-like isoform X1 [Coffea arabica]
MGSSLSHASLLSSFLINVTLHNVTYIVGVVYISREGTCWQWLTYRKGYLALSSQLLPTVSFNIIVIKTPTTIAPKAPTTTISATKCPRPRLDRFLCSVGWMSLQTVELKVRMCCSGCERVVKDAIHKLRGVDSVDVELEMDKVTVIGYVDRNKVLTAVRRAGKRAEFWPYPNPPLYFTSTTNYFKDTTSDFKESYNYWRHGYNAADRHGSLPVTQRGDDKVSNMFNDDNVNACCLM